MSDWWRNAYNESRRKMTDDMYLLDQTLATWGVPHRTNFEAGNRWVEISHEDGYIVLRCSHPGTYTVFLYDDEGWESYVPDTGLAQCVVVGLTLDETRRGIEYLLNEQPEGTDWLAWANQRMWDGALDKSQLSPALTAIQAWIDEELGFNVVIDGWYGDDHGSVHLMDGQTEIVMWDSAEWIAEPSLVFAILSAVDIGCREGAAAVWERLHLEAPT